MKQLRNILTELDNIWLNSLIVNMLNIKIVICIMVWVNLKSVVKNGKGILDGWVQILINFIENMD